MPKTFKEYLGVTGVRIGGVDNAHPIASLGDTPPKGTGSRDNRGVGLNASKKNTPLYKYLQKQGVIKKD